MREYTLSLLFLFTSVGNAAARFRQFDCFPLLTVQTKYPCRAKEAPPQCIIEDKIQRQIEHGWIPLRQYVLSYVFTHRYIFLKATAAAATACRLDDGTLAVKSIENKQKAQRLSLRRLEIAQKNVIGFCFCLIVSKNLNIFLD